jgi:PhnB protein
MFDRHDEEFRSVAGTGLNFINHFLFTIKKNSMKTESKIQKRRTVKAIPEGFNSITPFLVVEGADDFIDFLENAFDGKITSMTRTEDDQVMHATVQIGDSQIMLTDAMKNYPAGKCKLYLYVEDSDLVFTKAVKAGGTSLREPTTEFYGDRSGGVKDAWGNEWWISTHVEDVDEEELERRKKKFEEQQAVSAS